MFVIYLVLGSLLASIWLSYRVIAHGHRQGGTVDDLLAAKREKTLLLIAITSAFGYGLLVFVLDLLMSDQRLAPYVVLSPIVYLVLWLLLRLLWRPTGLR